MEGLVTLLLYAGLFYVMMRFGCGAHMVHGHGGHGYRDNAGTGGSAADPICGMVVDDEHGYRKMYDGRPYRFCSRACLDKFETDPRRYAITAGGER
jgi:YHS domain-containing protein